MMVSNTIELAGQLNEARGASFYEIGKRLAIGEKVSPGIVADMLLACGKSAGELEDLVGQLKHRETLRQRQAEQELRQGRRLRIEEEISKYNRELDLAVERHQRATESLQMELVEIRQETAACSNIEAQLSRTCPNRDLLGEFAKAHSQWLANEHVANAAKKGLAEVQATYEGSELGEDRNLWHGRLVRAKAAVEAAVASVTESMQRNTEAFRATIDF